MVYWDGLFFISETYRFSHQKKQSRRKVLMFPSVLDCFLCIDDLG
ncbi:hypothetical protein predicted by Glimmer/Critica [Streptococcus dysgalactiae subsp. equisimilis AC-2713]|uniref:Uncharacterized protein n=1 Tax=Streptococcus dysgalactiae subsp. equisimilis AC-2713 TaxID=759913 RepID=A0AB33R6R6_STREQ|nr:hypothetical protein predicted by Glimmer/Critica [Streptococcus dysgalactiae subsp. equisimilis AC-2713]